jgi:predicted nucleotidyltransferase
MSLIVRLQQKGLIHPPKWLPENTHFLVTMGSEAYGCSSGDSDQDLYGWTIPPRDMVFPHLAGEIFGFGTQKKRFDVWQEHHVEDKETRRQYDLAIYSVVRFVHLCLENNPNMIDSLFVPLRCVLHCTQVANILRENKRLFLHKGCFQKMKGYAYSSLHKMSTKTPEVGSKRYEDIKAHGFDCKYAYHIVRLLLECEQILVEHDLDLERNREQLKAVRRGEWSEEQIRQFFSDKEKSLEEVYHKSTLPYGPDEDAIKALLMKVLEQHYGSLDGAVKVLDAEKKCLLEIKQVMERYGI